MKKLHIAFGVIPQHNRNYKMLFSRAQESYIKKLWNGEYFNYDVDQPYHTTSCESARVASGSANLTGLGRSCAGGRCGRSAMHKVFFEFQCKEFSNGRAGRI